MSRPSISRSLRGRCDNGFRVRGGPEGDWRSSEDGGGNGSLVRLLHLEGLI